MVVERKQPAPDGKRGNQGRMTRGQASRRSVDAANEPARNPQPIALRPNGSEVLSYSVIEHELANADSPEKVRTIDGKLAVIQELFRKERRALQEQNTLATLRIRAQRRGIAIDFIQPRRPVENGHIESFNGRLRDECLNTSWFQSLDDARRAIEAWRIDYNQVRPHSRLGHLHPATYVAGCSG